MGELRLDASHFAAAAAAGCTIAPAAASFPHPAGSVTDTGFMCPRLQKKGQEYSVHPEFGTEQGLLLEKASLENWAN